MKNKIETLENEINLYEYHYRVLDNPMISDQQFDMKMKELQKLANEYPQYVSSNSPLNKIGVVLTDGFKKANHKRLMGSIANVYTIEELKEWFDKFNPDTNFKLEDKYDGISGSLIYKNKELIQSLTRGDGKIGDDITENAKMVWNIPSKLEKDVDEIRGEFVIFKRDFDKINSGLEKKFKNPRNLVSGTMKSLNSKVVKDRYVHFIPFQAFKDNKEIDYDFHKFYHISWITKQLNFVGSKDEILKRVNDIANSKSYKDRPYMTDGLVIKVYDYSTREKLGYTSGCPNWAIAFKFQQETAITEVENIEWQVGKSHITPVANLKPVELEGTTISRATLHNLTQLEKLNIFAGDKVEIQKAGFIIPQIVKNLSSTEHSSEDLVLRIPNKCPICDTLTEIEEKESKFLICPNTDCKGKKYVYLSNFVKSLKIDGIGDVLVRQLIDKEIVVDLPDLYSIKFDVLISLVGKKTAFKIKKNIDNSFIQSLKNIIKSLGIHQVGEGTSERLAKHVKTFERFLSINETEMAQIKDIGEETIKCIIDYRKRNEHSLKRLLDIFIIPVEDEKSSNVFENQIFVVTGKATKGRGELSNLIKDNGGKVSGSVSKKVDILIVGSLESENFSSTKTKKADSLGIKIENEFYLYDKLGIVEETKNQESDMFE